jgi:hypothetical protein
MAEVVMARARNLRFVARFALLSVVLCAGIGAFAHGAPARAQDSTVTAPDLPADTESKLAISNMLRQGVMRVRASGNFSPSEPSTLGEYLISLQQLFHLTPTSNPPKFTDVPPGSPYFAAAQAAAPYLNRQAMCKGCALSTNLLPGPAADARAVERRPGQHSEYARRSAFARRRTGRSSPRRRRRGSQPFAARAPPRRNGNIGKHHPALRDA